MALEENKSRIVFLSAIYVILFLFGTVLSDCASLDRFFFIRNKVSGLVLDSSDYKGIKIETFNQSRVPQRFYLHPASRTGLFNIYDSEKEKVLTYIPVGELFNEGNLTVDYSAGSLYQEWFLNADGTIINAGLWNYGMAVEESPWYTGNYVVVADASSFGTEQTFELTNAQSPTWS